MQSRKESLPPPDKLERTRRLIRSLRGEIHKFLVKEERSKKIGRKIDRLVFHQTNTTLLAWRLGREIGLSNNDLHRLIFATLLHDTGKLITSNGILEKDDNLGDAEREEIEKHPRRGYKILQSIGLNKIAKIILHHHEWWNGKGYPDRLKGDEIPRLSQIITLVDAWDSMRNRDKRSSGNGTKSKPEAFREIQEKSGIQFNPELVKAFTQIMQEEFC